MNVLFVGDIFGKPGRQFLEANLGNVQKQHDIDITLVNGENMANGHGITPEMADQLCAMGVDLITSGNHIWGKPEIREYIANSKRLLRPHNMPAQSPGSGIGYVTAKSGKTLGVLNLIGRAFMGNFDCPFQVATAALQEMRKRTNLIFLDFHAETTSEKRAMGWYLDGSISALIGTHTHIQTADEEILPGGTGYLTDAGMTGPHDSVIGVEKNEIIQKFITQMPTRFTPATSGLQLNGVVLRLDEASGRCLKIERLRIKETT